MHALQRSGAWRVETLITTVTDAYDRVSMHGVRRALVRDQAASIGIPLVEVVVPPQSSNEIYERAMGEAFDRLHEDGIRRVAFGDIFLEDLREYRERQLAASGLECLFPIWKQPTADLARSFIRDGFEAVAVCINPADAGRFVRRTCVRRVSSSRISRKSVDPCGENGEFHTFVWDGADPAPADSGHARRSGATGRFRLLRPPRGGRRNDRQPAV